MNPKITEISDNGQTLEFRLSGVNVSFANALRRTILSDIERICINRVEVEINTSPQFHNEILKHRIQCVPVIPQLYGKQMTVEEMETFCESYRVELDVQNKTTQKIYVSSDSFRLFDIKNNIYLDDNTVRGIFPAYKNHYFIDLMRLYPTKGSNIPGEQIKLKGEMSLQTAKTDGCFAVVSKCSYQNTQDNEKIIAVWSKIYQEEKQRLEKNKSQDETMQDITDKLKYKERDFMILDAQRYFKENSFDFVVETNGIYANLDIIVRACQVLVRKFTRLIELIDIKELPVIESHMKKSEFSTLENCWDIILENEDYTVGYILDYIMYRLYFEEETTNNAAGKNGKLSYCGFIKYHPHNLESVLRVAFVEQQEQIVLYSYLRNACQNAISVFNDISKGF